MDGPSEPAGELFQASDEARGPLCGLSCLGAIPNSWSFSEFLPNWPSSTDTHRENSFRSSLRVEARSAEAWWRSALSRSCLASSWTNLSRRDSMAFWSRLNFWTVSAFAVAPARRALAVPIMSAVDVGFFRIGFTGRSVVRRGI